MHIYIYILYTYIYIYMYIKKNIKIRHANFVLCVLLFVTLSQHINTLVFICLFYFFPSCFYLIIVTSRNCHAIVNMFQVNDKEAKTSS